MNFFSLETTDLDYPETLEKLYTDDQFFSSQISAATAHAFDAVNDAIFVVDMTMQIQHWNRAAEQIYGWLHTEVIGRSILEVIPVIRYIDGSDVTAQMHTVTTTGTWRGDIVQHTRDGREIFIDSSMRTFTNDEDLVIGVIVINRDITARKQAEASLRENETRLHLLAEYAHDMIFRYRLAPTITLEYISPIIEQLTGYPREVFYTLHG
jgi:two-component system, cell cycle sensor histidine kinase and response regulator CckA